MNTVKKNTILYVLPCLDYGGAELQTISQINAFVKQGYSVHLLLLNNIIALNELLEIPTTHLHTLFFPYTTPSLKAILQARTLISPIAKIIHQFDISHVMAILPLSHYVMRLVKISKLRNTKKELQLIVYHCSMQYEANPLNTMGKRLFNQANKQLAKWADNTSICVSKAVQKNIEKGFFLRNPQVVYNAIPNVRADTTTSNTLLNQLKISNESFTLLIPGRLHPSKGHVFFLKVLKELIDKYSLSQTEIQLLIVGKGSEQQNIEQGIKEHALEKYVQLLGNLENKRLLALLGACDLIVVPSINEAFGIVAIETLMQGGLLLCSDAGGLPEIITNEYNGFICPKLDHQAFLQKLSYLYQHRHQVLIPKQRLYEDFQKRFTLAAQMQQLKRILNL